MQVLRRVWLAIRQRSRGTARQCRNARAIIPRLVDRASRDRGALLAPDMVPPPSLLLAVVSDAGGVEPLAAA